MGSLARALRGSLWGLGAGAVAATTWGLLVERTRYQLRQETVPILDSGSAPIRVLHLSDLHLAPWQSGAISWIRQLAELEPDVIVGTGDFFGHPDALPAIEEALSVFHGVPGVVVHGSNDFFGPRPVNPLRYVLGERPEHPEGQPLDFDGLRRLYTDTLGWHDIDNGAVSMTFGDQIIEWVGVGDAHIDRDDLASLPETVERLREESATSNQVPHPSTTTIGVTHAPYRRVLDALSTQGAELILAGHTHGGQVAVPGIGALTTNSDLPNRFARGLHTWEHAGHHSYLNVSAGIGTSIYAPIRFACPPEAILLTLVGDNFGYA